ncbi:MAG: gliding motility-associated ABC transporter permease subunit GldF [Bacteroidales bacterium]
MLYIFKKELINFFSSLTGYIAIAVFLFVCSWFLWLSPNEFNVLDTGYANIDGLFIIAPWALLFLVPAITMRSFSEERKTGTIEMLHTRPITDTHLVLGKFFAIIVVISMSLLPSFLYLYTVWTLGSPVGNVDAAAFFGALMGLFLLASCYAAIGIFASSLTDSQIAAFLLTAIMCFFLYVGFDGVASLKGLKHINDIITSFGIKEHYSSISRGVIVLYDIVYFLGVIALFIVAARLRLRARMW